MKRLYSSEEQLNSDLFSSLILDICSSLHICFIGILITEQYPNSFTSEPLMLYSTSGDTTDCASSL